MSNETKTTAVAVHAAAMPQKVSVVNALAAKLECDPTKLMPLLKKTAFATCRTDEEFMAMCMVANTYNLNPILKEVYAFPSKGGAVVPIVGVDGWIKLMNANPAFDGIEFDEGQDYCTARIYRKDRTHAISATEWLAECIGTTEPWKRWPKRMLRHKAMIQAARIAFGFAGIYDEDEARRIASVGGTQAEPNPEPKPEGENAASPARKGLRDVLGLGKGKDAAKGEEAPTGEKKGRADDSGKASARTEGDITSDEELEAKVGEGILELM